MIVIKKLRKLADHIADMDSGSGDASLLRKAADLIDKAYKDGIA